MEKFNYMFQHEIISDHSHEPVCISKLLISDITWHPFLWWKPTTRMLRMGSEMVDMTMSVGDTLNVPRFVSLCTFTDSRVTAERHWYRPIRFTCGPNAAYCGYDILVIVEISHFQIETVLTKFWWCVISDEVLYRVVVLCLIDYELLIYLFIFIW